jgi:hypothetical protein
MGNLRNGIRLFAGGIERPEESRVWLSSGTSRAVERITAVRYSEDALIPSPPWRVPTLDECNGLGTREAPRDWRECVGLVRIPDGVLAPFNKLYTESVNTEEDYNALTNHPDYQEALTGVFEYIKLFCLSEEDDLQMIGLSFNDSGLDTVTFDINSNCYIGLHFDSWDCLPFRQRHQARNRICINMGREDRFLLLINLTAVDIFHLLLETQRQEIQKRGWWSRVIPKSRSYHDDSAEAYARMGATSVGQEFMKYYPEYPVHQTAYSTTRGIYCAYGEYDSRWLHCRQKSSGSQAHVSGPLWHQSGGGGLEMPIDVQSGEAATYNEA